MADQPGALGGINWDEYFPFTRIFKAFRMAIQPSKLGLALGGVVLMGLLGYVLDGLWPKSCKPVGPEIWAYWQRPDIGAWRENYRAERLNTLRREYAPGGLLKSKAPDAASLDSPGAVKQACADLKAQFRSDVAELEKDKPDKPAIAALAREYTFVHERLSAYRTRGVFDSFLGYEQQALGHFLDEARQVVLLDFWAIARNTNTVISDR